MKKHSAFHHRNSPTPTPHPLSHHLRRIAAIRLAQPHQPRLPLPLLHSPTASSSPINPINPYLRHSLQRQSLVPLDSNIPLSTRIDPVKCLPRKQSFVTDKLLEELRREKDTWGERERRLCRDEVEQLVGQVIGLTDLVQIHRVLRGIQRDCTITTTTPFSKLLLSQLLAQTHLLLQDPKTSIPYFKQSQYYSRRLNLNLYTIHLCFQLAETFKKLSDFQQASKYFEHALEISLTIRDRYQEMKAIDGLGVCFYYRGNLAVANHYHSSLSGLERVEAELIVDRYRNIQRMDELGSSRRASCDGQQELSDSTCLGLSKVIEKDYDLRNVQNVNRSIHDQSKDSSFVRSIHLTKKHIKQVSEIGKKIRSVGKCRRVERYQGQSQDFRNQVLISHTARNRLLMNNKKSNSLNKSCRLIFGRLGGILCALS